MDALRILTRKWTAEFSRRYVHYRRDTWSLAADALAALYSPKGGRKIAGRIAAFGFLVLAVLPPLAALLINKDAVGNGTVFVVAFLVWSVVLAALWCPVRWKMVGREAPEDDDYRYLALVWLSFPVVVYVALTLIQGGKQLVGSGVVSSVWGGALGGVAFATSLDVGPSLIALALVWSGGRPLYEAAED